MTDWKYTELALRFVRKGTSFDDRAISQCHGPHKSHSNSDAVGQKKAYRFVHTASLQPPKRRRTDSAGFNPINGLQSDERTIHILCGAETGRHSPDQSEQPLQVASCHDTGHSGSHSHVADIHASHTASPSSDGRQAVGSLRQVDCVSSRENSLAPTSKSGSVRYHLTSGSHTDEVAAHLTLVSRSVDHSWRPIITQQHIERVRTQNEALKTANSQKQKEIVASRVQLELN